jgi:hypothetical protein
MAERRKHAADGCFCTHESNCYYPSLAFNPKHLVEIKKLERQMKRARADLVAKGEPAADAITAG